MKNLIWARHLLLLAAMLLLIVQPSDAEAQVTVQSAGGGDLNVTIVPPGNFLTRGEAYPGTATPTFRICWLRVGQWGAVCDINQINWPTGTHIGTRQIGGLTLGKKYYLVGYCNCRAPGGGWDWIEIGSHNLTYGPPPPPPPMLLGSTRVRLRNLTTGQCAYIDGNGWVARHWACWPDPNMVFYRDAYSDGFSTFRDRRSGQCLWDGPRNLPVTGAKPCGWPGTRFQVQDGGGGAVRLFAPITGDLPFSLGAGGCLYADGGNGGQMMKEACVGDRTRFALDPA